MDPSARGVVRAERLARMLGARSIAVIGASERPGSFGFRMTTEALRSPGKPAVHLVHPTRTEVLGRPCRPSLTDLESPVDLVLLGVPDAALVDQLTLARERGDSGAVVFGSATGLGAELVEAAGDLALCGAGCMGFVNVARGVRAIGYLERDPLEPGGIALVTHSGSVFSALLRTHRRLEYSFAVSSGQELVTRTADYLQYALRLPETTVVGLFLETLRDVPLLRAGLAEAAERDIPVVALTVGGTPSGRELVVAHSGALAGDDAAWEALFAAHGVHRAAGLDELVDLLEMFSIGRRVRRRSVPLGLATVHDSGAERVLVADIAQEVGVDFAPLTEPTKARLRDVLGPGLEPVNPLDVWSTGADTARLLTECLAGLAADDGVGALALAVDLVPEYDGDDSYPAAVEAVLALTDKPVCVLSNLGAAVDETTANRLRARGVPVLEGTRSGLRALAALLAHRPPPVAESVIDVPRRDRWRARLAGGPLHQSAALDLLGDYGLRTAHTSRAGSLGEAVAAASTIGFPVVLKTDDPSVVHKLAAGGVHIGLRDEAAVAVAYTELAGRLGPSVCVQPQLERGPEVCLGLVHDPLVGPLVMVAPGGTLVEVVGHRRLGLPPLAGEAVDRLLADPVLTRLLARSSRPALGLDAVRAAVCSMSQLAVELGDAIDVLDVNPLVVTDTGAVAVDAFLVPR